MADSKKYRLHLSYDGTRYCGWQIQPNGNSIQEELEKALSTILREPIRVMGSGRTDAGVHALEQTAHFSTPLALDCTRTLYAVNGLLPYDIRIQDLASTLDSFHAQYAALSKEYHYHLWLERYQSPFSRLYRHHFFDTRFSLPLLKEGAAHFIGTHDFATFANVGSTVLSTVRTITRLEVVPQEGGIRLEFEGNGFLYKMVRNIVGTLLEIATGRRLPSEVSALLAAKDRRAAAAAAPPRGLFLIKVHYPARFFNSSENEGKWEKSLPVSTESCLISD